MMRFKIKHLLLPFVFATIISGCKKWDDHIEVNSPDLTKDLQTAIAEDPNLSKFAELVTKAGLDTLLRSSKTYTVWAPSNTALATLDPSISNDPTKLRSFILNHVSYQLYFTRDAQTSIRIGMLNGKYNNFLGNKFEDATLTSADKYVKNGVLHITDKYILVLPSLWDYINSTVAQYTQNSFIAGLNYPTFDPSLAVIDSISSSTGLPVYHPGTGIVIKNTFNERTFDTRREDKQYTYFVIANAGFTLKSDSLKPYFNTGVVAKTDSLAKWNTVKDLIVDILYPTSASLPPVIFSKFGVPIPISASTIIETKKVSNGIVYVLSSSAITTASKFQQVRIEAENQSGFSRTDKTGNINYRVRRNPVTGQNYNDLYVSATNVTGTGVIGFYSYYTLSEMPSMKYNVYAAGVNDFQTGAVLQNISANYLVSSTPTPVYTLLSGFAHNVPLSSVAGAYNEVLLGQFTSTLYGTLEMRLIQANATAVATNTPSVLDYLRIVPVP
jgi:hypothetical protein